MLDLFKRLGDSIEAPFQAVSYDEQRFPRIAHTAVQRADLPRRLDIGELVAELVAHPTTLENRPIDSFGDPPVLVYRARYFCIQVLFWLDSTTAIHQHAFSGAFQVLRGSSLHTTYRWTTAARISSRLALGTATQLRSELLVRGDSHEIVAGQRFAHALFHLDVPSVSMVVRTYTEGDAFPQYTFELPGVRTNEDASPPDFGMDLKLRLLELLRRTDRVEARARCQQLARTASCEDLYRLLKRWSPDDACAAIVRRALRRRFPRWARSLEQAISEHHRLAVIAAKRTTITAPDQRFLLALMLNIRSRKDLLALTRQRFPEHDPVDAIVELVRALTASSPVGASLLGVVLDDQAILVFRAMLRGYAGAALAKHLARTFEISRAQEGVLRQLEQSLRQSPLFSTMFRDARGRG